MKGKESVAIRRMECPLIVYRPQMYQTRCCIGTPHIETTREQWTMGVCDCGIRQPGPEPKATRGNLSLSNVPENFDLIQSRNIMPLDTG